MTKLDRLVVMNGATAKCVLHYSQQMDKEQNDFVHSKTSTSAMCFMYVQRCERAHAMFEAQADCDLFMITGAD